MDALAHEAVWDKLFALTCAAARRDRRQRTSCAAAGAARRAHPGHGGDRRHRHRAVGSQGQGGRAAGLAPARRREPAALHLCDRRLLPAGRDECRLRRGAGAVSRSRLPRGQAQDRRRQRRRRGGADRRGARRRSATTPDSDARHERALRSAGLHRVCAPRSSRIASSGSRSRCIGICSRPISPGSPRRRRSRWRMASAS